MPPRACLNCAGARRCQGAVHVNAWAYIVGSTGAGMSSLRARGEDQGAVCRLCTQLVHRA